MELRKTKRNYKWNDEKRDTTNTYYLNSDSFKLLQFHWNSNCLNFVKFFVRLENTPQHQ